MKTQKFIFGVILLILFIYYIRTINPHIPVNAGNRKWNVVAGYENRSEAAKLLSAVHNDMIEFMRILKKKYHIDEPEDITLMESQQHMYVKSLPGDVYNIVDNLLDNYNPDVFYENDPIITSNTSYTLNKGEAMYLCLRSKDEPMKLVNRNTMLFVMLHEASHIANYRGWGHNEDFWKIFKFILHEARLAGVYTPVDYSKNPIVYCGLNVDYNPIFDNNIPNIWE